MDKERLRGIIAMQTREFLRLGGVIEKVPRVVFCPDHMQWARDRGMDYQPWSQHGSPDFIAGMTELDEGCYITRPKKTEE